MGCTCSTSPRPPCGWCESGQRVDWDKPLVFADNRERTWVADTTPVGGIREWLYVVHDNQGRKYHYTQDGEPYMHERELKNIDRVEDEARRRVEAKRAEAAARKQIPGWGMF